MNNNSFSDDFALCISYVQGLYQVLSLHIGSLQVSDTGQFQKPSVQKGKKKQKHPTPTPTPTPCFSAFFQYNLSLKLGQPPSPVPDLRKQKLISLRLDDLQDAKEGILSEVRGMKEW